MVLEVALEQPEGGHVLAADDVGQPALGQLRDPWLVHQGEAGEVGA
jgi:hypothetical protein